LEARATVNGANVSKTFVAAILVLVAMGLGAMGGYVAKGLSISGSAAQGQQVHAAPGTVLRQDNPAQVEQVHAAPGSVLRQDSGTLPATEPIRSDTRGDHGQLP